MVKINLKQYLFDLDGRTPITERVTKMETIDDKEERKIIEVPLDVKMILRRVLAAPVNPEQNLSPDEHVKRFDLSIKLMNSNEIEFDNEQVALLKKLVARSYTTLVAAQVIKLLEGQNPFEAVKNEG